MKALTLAALALAASTFTANAQETWRIGALYPLTGSLALLGNENLNGARIAVDMINEKGGIAGKKVELVQGATNGARQRSEWAPARPAVEPCGRGSVNGYARDSRNSRASTKPAVVRNEGSARAGGDTCV